MTKLTIMFAQIYVLFPGFANFRTCENLTASLVNALINNTLMYFNYQPFLQVNLSPHNLNGK